MSLSDFKTVVDIVSGIATVGAILIGGWWFIVRRSLAGNLEIALTAKDMKPVSNFVLAVINVHIKNVGQTRIRMDYCVFAAKLLAIPENTQGVETLRTGALNYPKGLLIFKFTPAVEPSEEIEEDIALAVLETATFAAGVKFVERKKHPWAKKQDVWDVVALFRASDATPDVVAPPKDAQSQQRLDMRFHHT